MNDPIEREDAINSIYKLKKTVIKHKDLNYRDGLSDAIEVIQDLPSADRPHVGYTGVDEDYLVSVQEVLNITAETGALETQRRVRELARRDSPQEWTPCSERLPKHSYTKRFWLTVKLDDDEGTVTTLIGTWGAWGGRNGSKSYDAFDCWKDVMINGGIYRLSQPIPKERVLAWMPAPEPWKGADDEQTD